jgi:hypothetical protein
MLQILPFSLVLHFMFSFWFYGNEEVLKDDFIPDGRLSPF